MTGPTRDIQPNTIATGAEADVSAARQLSDAITRVARLMRRHAAGGLTPTQYAVLGTIARRGPITVGELGRREQVSAPTITVVVTKLESAGLVQKTQDTDDKRSWTVTLTDNGHQQLADNQDRKTQWVDTQLAQLSQTDQTKLIEAVGILTRLATVKDTSLEDTGPAESPTVRSRVEAGHGA